MMTCQIQKVDGFFILGQPKKSVLEISQIVLSSIKFMENSKKIFINQKPVLLTNKMSAENNDLLEAMQEYYDFENCNVGLDTGLNSIGAYDFAYIINDPTGYQRKIKKLSNSYIIITPINQKISFSEKLNHLEEKKDFEYQLN